MFALKLKSFMLTCHSLFWELVYCKFFGKTHQCENEYSLVLCWNSTLQIGYVFFRQTTEMWSYFSAPRLFRCSFLFLFAFEYVCAYVCVSTCLQGSCVLNMWGPDPAVTNHTVGGLSQSTEIKCTFVSAGTGRELSVVNINKWASSEHSST